MGQAKKRGSYEARKNGALSRRSMPRRNTELFVPLFTASFITVFDIGWRKVGGYRSGGRHSDAHSWGELQKFVPEFVFLIVVFFLGVYIWEAMKPREEYFICPHCDKPFSDECKGFKLCPSCGGSGEPIEAYYERHPDKK